MPVPTGELIDTKQCAALLGLHEITLIVWRRENRGPPWLSAPDARVILYRKQAVLDWLTACTPPPPESDGRHMMRLRAKAGTTERVEYESGSTPTEAELAPRRVVTRRAAKPASTDREAKRMAAVRAMQRGAAK